VKANKGSFVGLPLAVILAGCATNIVATGPDTYMMSDIAGWVNYRRAVYYCSDQGKDMAPVASSSYYGTLNTADDPRVFFKCVPISESATKRQGTQPAPGM
jgi:hypothetical protein